MSRKLTDYQQQASNANRHTERGMRLLEKSIQEDGWIGAITAAADGEIFDGSARHEVGTATGFDDAIVIESDGSKPVIIKRVDIPSAADPRAKKLGIAANRIASLNLEWEPGVLAELAGDLDLSSLFTDMELADLAQPTLPAAGDGGDEFPVEEALEKEPRCKAGELWLIDGGRHRLVVGDCTDAATVSLLMGDDKIEMVWTDPPYGVAIGDKNKFLNAIAPSNRVEENLENDTLDEPALMEMLRGSFALAAKYCLAGGAWYVAAPARPLHVLFGMALKELNIWHQTIQWVKNNATFAPLGVDYHWRAEPIFYGWLPGAAHRYYGGRQQDTVWEIDRPMASPEHPTMKPIELVQRAVENSSRLNEVVYDPFLGSGTTLVASHRAARRCYGCEISEKYATVIIDRAEAEGLPVERA